MWLRDIVDVAAYLDRMGQYAALLERYHNTPEDRSIWFEMVFAYWLHDAGLAPAYEVNVNPTTARTVDFAADYSGLAYHMELVRIENSDQIQAHLEAQRDAGKMMPGYELLLKSDAPNPFFRTAAQLIRVQEKILEKIDKFAEPSEAVISLVVVDCSNINVGALDDEDVRMIAFGRAKQPHYQEYWDGLMFRGLFDHDFVARHAESLRRKLSAVVFVRKLEPNALARLLMACNSMRNNADPIRRLPIFSKVQDVKAAL